MIGEECYIYDSEDKAVAAELYISNVGGLPKLGRNQKTGEIQENKQPTVKWSDIHKRKTDGKYFFLRVPSEKIKDIPQDVQLDFDSKHPFTVEICQENWF